jgi:thioesterase domain-containing protein
MERLRAVQLRGPYRLAGHCSAGVVAFELARQLWAAGEVVEALILVEPPPLRAWQGSDGRLREVGLLALPTRVCRRIRAWAVRLRGAAAAGRLFETLRTALEARWRRPVHAHVPASVRRRVDRAHAEAVARYAPGHYAGLVTCVRTQAGKLAGEFDPDTWRGVVDFLRIEVVPGDHESCLAAEARALAGRLRASVEDARGATVLMARERPRAASAATDPVPPRR